MPNPFLHRLDKMVHTALKVAGVADSGLYTPPGSESAPIKCDIYFTGGVQPIGDAGQRLAERIEVAYVIGSMSIPPTQNGKVLIDGVTYSNSKKISDDGSLSTWVVRVEAVRND